MLDSRSSILDPRSSFVGFVCLVMLLAAAPGRLRAEEAPPEALLSSGTQLYFRWDGGDAHQAAREKSALGKTLREDAGTFLVGLFPQIIESVASNQTAQLLKKGVERSLLEKTQRDVARAPKLGHLLARHGLIIAAETRLALPPDIQATLIVPGAGPDPSPLFSTVRLFALLNELEVHDGKFAGRSVQYLNLIDQPSSPTGGGKAGKGQKGKAKTEKKPAGSPFPVHVAWWVEGSHAVLALGTRSPEAIVQRFQEKSPRLAESPLFQKVRAFKEFETGIRGFVDVASLVKVAGTVPGMAPILEAWGLPGFKSLVLHMGYDGEFTRTLAELDMPSPRKGIMRIFGGKPFSLADLPPVPPDAQQFIMFNLNPTEVLDAVGQALASPVPGGQGGGSGVFQDFVKSINDGLDLNLRTDLLDALGDRTAIYASPADGILFSQVALIQVKDPGKLDTSLDHALKSLAIGGSIRMKKKSFRDFQIRQIHLKQGSGFPFVPSVAVYKNWLVVGFTPQAVQGFILRTTGELPAWKPESQVQAALDRLPKEFTLLSVSDPRPTIKQVLAIVPLAVGVASAFPGSTEPSFDVGTLPNGHLAVKHLFPNVMVWTDDGIRIRVDSRGSLELPVGFTGLDSYGILLLSFLFRFGG
jgi:hypothetical protein